MRGFGFCLGGIGLAAALVCAGTAAQAGGRHGLWKPSFKLEFLGRYTGSGEGAAEIAAYDKRTKRLFVTNAAENKLTIINISNPAAPTEVAAVDLSPYGGGPNSAAVSHGRVAVAVQADPKTAPGSVVFFDTDGNFKGKVTVGALPDMLTFTPNGKYLLVANEGEPNSYNQPDSVDPEGSISIISAWRHTIHSGGRAHPPISSALTARKRRCARAASASSDPTPPRRRISSRNTSQWMRIPAPPG